MRSYPLPIDAEATQRVGRRATACASSRSELLRRRREHLILRVDRADLSKNVLRGFTAFDLFLEQHPEFREKSRSSPQLMPSRTDVPEYAEYLERIEALVAVVNHRHGTPDWMPIQLKLRDDLEEAVAAYKHYDVLLVNAMFDGMNLVAKEGPLVNERDGVSILSREHGRARGARRVRAERQPVRHPGARGLDPRGADDARRSERAGALRRAEGDRHGARPGRLDRRAARRHPREGRRAAARSASGHGEAELRVSGGRVGGRRASRRGRWRRRVDRGRGGVGRGRARRRRAGVAVRARRRRAACAASAPRRRRRRGGAARSLRGARVPRAARASPHAPAAALASRRARARAGRPRRRPPARLARRRGAGATGAATAAGSRGAARRQARPERRRAATIAGAPRGARRSPSARARAAIGRRMDAVGAGAADSPPAIVRRRSWLLTAPIYDLMLLLDTTAPDDQRAKILADVEAMIDEHGELVGQQHDWGSAGPGVRDPPQDRRRVPPDPVPRRRPTLLEQLAAHAADHRRRRALPDHQARARHAGPPPSARRAAGRPSGARRGLAPTGPRPRRAAAEPADAPADAPRCGARLCRQRSRRFATTLPRKERRDAGVVRREPSGTPVYTRRRRVFRLFRPRKEPPMAATNINRVDHHRQPHRRSRAALAAERHLGLQAARRVQHAPQGQLDRRVGRQAQLLRRHRVGRAGRELRPLPLQGPPGRGRRPPRVARVGGPGGQQAPGDRHHRRLRAVPRRPRDDGGGGGGGGFTPRSDVPVDTGDFAAGAARRPAAARPSAPADDDIPF